MAYKLQQMYDKYNDKEVEVIEAMKSKDKVGKAIGQEILYALTNELNILLTQNTEVEDLKGFYVVDTEEELNAYFVAQEYLSS